MNIPMNDLRRAYQADAVEIDAAVDRVVSSGWYALGPEVQSFESDFAKYCGVNHAIGVGNGTDALVLSLQCLGIGPGDEVITAPNAGGYSSAAIYAVGATPVYADIDPITLTIDPTSAASLVTPAVKAIIATHLFGSLADVTALRTIADESGTKLVEDCAQAHGATLNGVKAGAFGDVATFSFYPSKNLGAIGDAGAVVTSDDDLAKAIGQLRQYGWDQKYTVARPGGGNSRLDPIQAAVLQARLSRLDERNARRRELVSQYAEALGPLGMPIYRSQGDSYVGHLCVTSHPQRDDLRKHLADSGIATDIHYPILDPDQPGWQGFKSRSDGLPVSKQMGQNILSLPMFPEMSDEEHRYVCQSVASFSGMVSSGVS